MYDIGEEQRKVLESAGDSIDQAFFRQVDTVEYSENQILYRQTDTLVNGILYDAVLVYSTNPELAIYKPSFSQVGQGKGNYRQINSTANGKVFEWVAPANGALQGDFEPVLLLPAPKRKRMISGAAFYKKKGMEGQFGDCRFGKLRKHI